jgi:hypothetical protein
MNIERFGLVVKAYFLCRKGMPPEACRIKKSVRPASAEPLAAA